MSPIATSLCTTLNDGEKLGWQCKAEELDASLEIVFALSYVDRATVQYKVEGDYVEITAQYH